MSDERLTVAAVGPVDPSLWKAKPTPSAVIVALGIGADVIESAAPTASEARVIAWHMGGDVHAVTDRSASTIASAADFISKSLGSMKYYE
jgi:hypothetical protein